MQLFYPFHLQCFTLIILLSLYLLCGYYLAVSREIIAVCWHPQTWDRFRQHKLQLSIVPQQNVDRFHYFWPNYSIDVRKYPIPNLFSSLSLYYDVNRIGRPKAVTSQFCQGTKHSYKKILCLKIIINTVDIMTGEILSSIQVANIVLRQSF